MKAAFVGVNPETFDRVYAQKQREALAKRVELVDDVITDIHDPKLRDVEVIFSTWGMPAPDEAEIREFLPELKYVFYAAGTVQAFVPVDLLERFVAGVEGTLGKGACHVLSIRPQGGVECQV